MDNDDNQNLTGSENGSSLKMPGKSPETQIDYTALTPPEPMGGNTQNPNLRSMIKTNPSPPPPILEPPSNQISSPVSTTPAPPPPPGPITETMEPVGRPIGSILLMFFIALLLVLGVLVFFSWKGWINLGGLQKYWGGKTTPSPSPTSSLSSSPTTTPSSEVVTNANDRTRKADLAKIKDGLEKYFVAENKFPATSAAIKTSDSSNILEQTLVPKYLDKLPLDPLTPKYYYSYQSDGQTFQLTCVLEDKTDPEGTSVGQYYIYKLTGSGGT